jgi:hypothetical protein
MNDIYTITNLNGYAEQVREAAAKSLSENYNDNLDDYITINQVINLVKKECVGFDEEGRPILDQDTNETIFDNVVVWLHNVGLAKLASIGLIECAWDDNANEMIFWSAEKPKKETKNVSTKNTRRKNKKTKGSDSGL